jgi:hypothetical protein
MAGPLMAQETKVTSLMSKDLKEFSGKEGLMITVENAGDFVVPLSAVEAVHSQKVILNCAKLERRLRRAIGHAHDAEEPDA